MAFPASGHSLLIYYAIAFPPQIDSGNAILDLAGTYGFRIMNPWDNSYQIIEHFPPGASNPSLLGGVGERNSSDMMFVTQMWGDDVDDMFLKCATITKAIEAIQNYIKIGGGVYCRFGENGGNTYRRYGTPYSISIPLAGKTQHLASTKGMALLMKCHDPSWYSHTGVVKTIAVVGGTGTTGLFDPLSLIQTNRIAVQIKKNSADNPTNPTVSENGTGSSWTFTITGSLTGANDFWWVDSVTGQVLHYNATTGVYTDAMDDFAGSFPYIESGWKRINAVDTVASDFQVTAHYLPRIA
jgi:hypothetical protein